MLEIKKKMIINNFNESLVLLVTTWADPKKSNFFNQVKKPLAFIQKRYKILKNEPPWGT